MSRIGKKPIEIPKGVTVDLKQGTVSVKGPKGTLSREVPPNVQVKVEDSLVSVVQGTPRWRAASQKG